MHGMNIKIIGAQQSRIHNICKNIKLPEDGARTPKHVAEIIILFYANYMYICWCNNKY
jgi:hypothetical protein